jgi:hypothetical protein
MESTHTNTLESLDSKMDLGLVRQRAAIVARVDKSSDSVGGTIEGVMDFDDVDNYNNLSRRIIAFLCIDSTNPIQLLHSIQFYVLALFVTSASIWRSGN